MSDYDYEEAAYWHDVTHLAHWIVSRGYDPVMADVCSVVERLFDSLESVDGEEQ